MNRFLTEPIVLSNEQAAEFLDTLRRPDQRHLDRLNQIFTKMEQDIHVHRNGTDIDVEIDGLDLSFLDEEDDVKPSFNDNIELHIEDSFALNTKFVFHNRYKKNEYEHLTTIHDNYMIHKQDSFNYEAGKDKPFVFLINKGKSHILQEYGTKQPVLSMA